MLQIVTARAVTLSPMPACYAPHLEVIGGGLVGGNPGADWDLIA